MSNIGNDIGNLTIVGPNISWGFWQIGLPAWFHWPNLGLMGWLIVALVCFILAITVGPKFGLFYGNPPYGHTIVVTRSLFPTRSKRPKMNPDDGTVLMEEITEKGITRKVPVMETVWASGEKLLRTITNQNEFYVDPLGFICRVGTKYNPKTGKDVSVDVELDYEKEAKKKKEEELEKRKKNPLLNIYDKAINVLKVTYGIIGFPFGIINRYLADEYAIFYLGFPWVINGARKHDVLWWTRKGLNPAVRRRERRRDIRTTRVSTSFDILEKPMKDKFGFPWTALITIQYRIRNVSKAWLEISDSDNQMIQLVRSAFIQWWQENVILVYEGEEIREDLLRDQGKQVILAGKNTESENKAIADKFHLYLKKQKIWLGILNDLGREIEKIAIDDKEAIGAYADLIAAQRKAEIDRKVTETNAKAAGNALADIAPGKDAFLQAHEKHGAFGMASLMRPDGSAVSSETTLGDVVLSNVVPGIGKELRKTGIDTAEKRKEQTNKKPQKPRSKKTSGNKLDEVNKKEE